MISNLTFILVQRPRDANGTPTHVFSMVPNLTFIWVQRPRDTNGTGAHVLSMVPNFTFIWLQRPRDAHSPRTHVFSMVPNLTLILGQRPRDTTIILNHSNIDIRNGSAAAERSCHTNIIFLVSKGQRPRDAKTTIIAFPGFWTNLDFEVIDCSGSSHAAE